MIRIKVDTAKASFFDREKVLKAVDAATRKVLSRFGAFVRTAARSSMRRRKKVSEPGNPPSAHLGLVKQFLFFAYDAARRSVVIGPALLNGRGGDQVLRRLEEGGDVARGNRTLHYRARPFMGPAFRQEQKRAPEMWRNSVRR